MRRFARGQRVLVPCDVQPGPFATEKLITIRSGTDVTSGFVQNDFLVWPPTQDADHALLVGVVERSNADEVVVRLPGSFFTTNGITALPKAWADEHLTAARQ